MTARHLLLLAPLALLATLLAGCTEPVSPPAATTPAAANTVSCTYSPAGKAAKPVNLPTGQNVPASGTVTLTLHMTAGDVVMTLNRAGAPCAVHSLESLVQQKYLDDTACHRLVPGFVLQCGDPTGTSQGGPGYKFNDELSGREAYPYGTVAMANAGSNTNGSQFFIVIGPQAASLPPQYDVLGQVDAASMAVIDAIAAQGVDPADPGGKRPKEGGRIITATLG